MNSVIHCLSNTTLLTEYFLKSKYQEDINSEKIEHHIVNEWIRLIQAIWNNNCTIAPHSFNNTVNIIALKNGILFGGGEQHDFHEYLNFLLDCMHNALSQEVGISVSGEAKNEFDKMALDAMNRWKNFFKNDYSVIVELFYGQLCTKIICPSCNHYSYNYDPICYISVPISENTNNYEKDITLEDCIHKYTEYEILDTDNQWECEKCKKKQNAKKKDNFWKLPKILIIQIKRFDKKLKKNNSYIKFPLQDLDLSKYCMGYNNETVKYNLYAVGCHEGNTEGGHYYCYSLNNNGNWYCYNDSNISQIDQDNVKKSNSAYCLFYIR